MKRILTGFKISTLLLVIFSFQLAAQQPNAANSVDRTKKIELKIFGNVQQSDITEMENSLTGYPGKILSHEYKTADNRLFVLISDATDPIDILQLLKIKGIRAGYRDDDNGYIILEPDGRTTRKLYFKE